MKQITILFFIIVLSACTKDEEVGIIPFSGNDVDSIVFYSVTGTDTTPYYAKKFTYSEDKNTYTEQWYEKIGNQPDLIPTAKHTYSIINNRIIINNIFLGDTTTYMYLLNSNKCVIRRTSKNDRGELLDSIVYNYYNDNYLQKAEQYSFNRDGEITRIDTITSIYSWSDGNIVRAHNLGKFSNSEHSESYTNYTPSNLPNPLAYNYLTSPLYPFLKYGRSSRNLILNEVSFYEFETSSTSYTYTLYPSNNSYLTELNPPSNSKYKIYYK